MTTVYTLTQATAAQALSNHGLDALGLTAPLLAPRWGNETPQYDKTQLTLTFPNLAPRAPWRGVLEYLDDTAAFRAVDGTPLAGPGAVLRLHPQAAQRLARLAQRYANAELQLHAIPETLLIRGLGGTSAPRSLDPDEALPDGAAGKPLSFHDGRGLIVCPVAVAAMLDDLLTTFGALYFSADSASAGGVGGVRKVVGLDSGVLAHVVTLHGRAFAAVPGGPGVHKTNASASHTGDPDAGGLVELAAGEQLAANGTGAAARLRLGWAGGGTMAAAALQVPALPTGITLSRRFLRAFAVDLDWHLRGNRSSTAVRGIPPDDQAMPADLQPQVRDSASVNYLVDGPDVMGAVSQVAARMTSAPSVGLMFAVSPAFEPAVGAPTAPGAGAHWAAALPGMAYPGAGDPSGFTARWVDATDVVVEIPAGFAPDGASVRVFPQRFQLIEAIAEEPSFVRADGATAIAASGNPVQLLLRNPFGLGAGDPPPNPAVLVFDLVVTPPSGERLRMWAALRASIAAGPASVPPDAFASPDPLAPFIDSVRSICPSPLFGLARSGSAGGASPPASALDLVRALASETQPRQGPRLPTMARHETVVVTGITDDAGIDASSGTLAWEAVLTGGRWARETRSAEHARGNPGNPAGPDTHAPGVHVTGALAWDLARHAVRRAQPLLPLGGSTPGWIAMSGGNNFNPPVPSGGATPGSASGVVLQTVAAAVETPELSLLPAGNVLDSTTPLSFQNVLAQVAQALGLPAPNLTVANEDRLLNELRREYFLSRHGSRDALWALARAIGEADELVYIETAGFARTARPGSGAAAAHEIDLVQKLADRMGANPNLKVLVCVPRETDFAPAFAPYVRRAILQRKEALDLLRNVDENRVAMFHPLGFPGRWAQLRTTTVVVDDVWCLSGATHFRRRGMSFDGSVALASFDRTIDQGYSLAVRNFRRALMAAKLGIAPPAPSAPPSAEWARLQRPASAFRLVADLLRQGGLGRLAPLWTGPTDHLVIEQSDDIADPDGAASGADLFLLLAGLLSETPD